METVSLEVSLVIISIGVLEISVSVTRIQVEIPSVHIAVDIVLGSVSVRNGSAVVGLADRSDVSIAVSIGHLVIHRDHNLVCFECFGDGLWTCVWFVCWGRRGKSWSLNTFSCNSKCASAFYVIAKS